MNRLFIKGLATMGVALMLAPVVHAQSEPERRDRVIAAYLIAFGRLPDAGEITHWVGRRDRDWTVPALVENHRNFLKSYTNERRAVIIRSYQMAMGRNPEEREITDHWNRNRTYAELLQDHVQWMKSGRPWVQLQGDALKDMVDRAYKAAGFTWYATPLGQFRKSDTEKQSKVLYDDGDIDYWKAQVKQRNLTYAQLVVMHLRFKADYCKRSIPTPAAKVGTVVRSQAAPVSGASTLFSGTSGNIVALGGNNIIAVGGMNVLAPGGGNIIAVGGMNVIAVGGNNLVVLDGKPFGG